MRSIAILIIFLAGPSLSAKKLTLKPGVYKMKSTMVVDGKEMDMQEEMNKSLKQMQESLKGMDLSMLPPEARKELEKMQGAGGAGLPGMSMEMCLYEHDLNMDKKSIAKMLAQTEKESGDAQNCKTKVIKMNSKEVHTTTKCDDGTTTFKLKVLSPTQFTQEIIEHDAKGKKGDAIKMSATFVGSKCPAHIVKRDAELKKIAEKYENMEGVGEVSAPAKSNSQNAAPKSAAKAKPKKSAPKKAKTTK